ncbi:(deoxy)nucleoside triphosphate pyrophosphohydrolase [Alteraurantiacibacter aquimixticola]|uniref:8-oxo-dGTP diphosphatase n=1 Tax=Alteraurantiacibacter aquimixticola TaxID=2489173 RepID=A0A4T3F6G1_9SPHN|nr:(deoxy)nucleoside triphosphate pyrophosphohydrolase [Alteraurantiacibacter aquimixticola]TIX52024.1 (deoxy)nucleoside triphosphate pyrophosphohydrolase [Alteraurantiacibacter aquimixticola]
MATIPNERLREALQVEKNPTWMPVVALALRDQSGRLLLQKRPPHKHHGGLWELPGGKVESDEFPRLALTREIAEELAITIDPASLTPGLLADEGEFGATVLFVYDCSRWSGEIRPLEHQEWGWFTFAEAGELPLAPMDRDLIKRMAQ